ncbi:hypothetical protein AF72_05210 [Xylella taiwanensis]|uniref:Uncharacterized protein n=1 Tax=Xylella taiwanensis TaxID=1444770 RepID=Z9JKH3_9GAMM|nr:hypothetical protein AF72_05210 [Xylella taiwanensis]
MDIYFEVYERAFSNIGTTADLQLTSHKGDIVNAGVITHVNAMTDVSGMTNPD